MLIMQKLNGTVVWWYAVVFSLCFICFSSMFFLLNNLESTLHSRTFVLRLRSD